MYLCATASPVLPCVLRGREPSPNTSCLKSAALKWGFTASNWWGNGMRAESGGEGHQLGLPVQGDRSGGGLGLPCSLSLLLLGL